AIERGPRASVRPYTTLFRSEPERPVGGTKGTWGLPLATETFSLSSGCEVLRRLCGRERPSAFVALGARPARNRFSRSLVKVPERFESRVIHSFREFARLR